MVLGRSLGKINTLRDLCQARPLWGPTLGHSEPSGVAGFHHLAWLSGLL